MTKTKSIYLAFLAVFLSPTAATADEILFENTWNGEEWSANCFFQCIQAVGAENFTLSSAATITGLTFEGWTVNGYDSSGLTVDWGIWSDNGLPDALPDALLFSGTVSPLATILGPISFGGGFYDRVLYALDIGVLSLAAGDYWASFRVNAGSGEWIYWAHTDVGDTTSAFYYLNDGIWRAPYPGSLNRANVFAVIGSEPSHEVPEPGTLALLGLGLVGMAARRRKKA